MGGAGVARTWCRRPWALRGGLVVGGSAARVTVGLQELAGVDGERDVVMRPSSRCSLAGDGEGLDIPVGGVLPFIGLFRQW